MFTEGQILYLQEVLGTSVQAFASAPTEVEVIVRIPDFAQLDRVFLKKILASVQLTENVLIESEVDGPSPVRAKHLLHFSEHAEFGRELVGKEIVWKLPSLASMNSGPQAAARKKVAWSVLQNFAKERL